MSDAIDETGVKVTSSEGSLDERLEVELCMTLLLLPPDIIDLFFDMSPIDLDGTLVPAAYIRARIPILRLDPSVDPDTTIQVSDASTSLTIEYPLHSIIWNAQCVEQLRIHDGVAQMTITSTEGLETLIRWLYTNDEDELYEALVQGNDKSMTFTSSFCRLVRAFGCVNAKFTGIVRAVYGDE